MPESIPIGIIKEIRECGYDEYWLQDQIFQNPEKLALGDRDLEALSKEKPQKSGGRLDILLKDSDDDSMFEVEVMLGGTDESHIIRTVEYWENVKRKWPQRQHYAVLVAESFTRRFFNVIHLLSQSVPIIAIQANIVEANNHKILIFTKVLDVYEEPEDTEVDEPTTPDDWRTKALWTFEAANALLEVVKPVYSEVSLNYGRQTISLRVNQKNFQYFWLQKRAGNKSRVGFRVAPEDMEKATKLLDDAGIKYDIKPRGPRIMTDKAAILANAETYRKIAELVQKFREG